MLKEALTRWVAPAVTGSVTLELRRGDDYTILDTKAVRSAYEPEKLSMEKTASAFTPEDRVGALEMQSLGVLDNRELLLHFAKALGAGSGPLGDLLLGEGSKGKDEA
jgi:argininosuccinate synthase